MNNYFSLLRDTLTTNNLLDKHSYIYNIKQGRVREAIRPQTTLRG